MFGYLQSLFPTDLASALEGANVRSPVMLFELATQQSHLINVFGTALDPERTARIAAMDSGNRADFFFMPIYGLFVFFTLAAMGKELGGSIWAAAGALGLLAAGADAYENRLLLSMTADLLNSSDELAVLPWPVWIKFGLLAIACGASGVALWKLKRPLLALLCTPSVLLIIPGILAPLTMGSLATQMIGVGWLGMGIHVVSRWLRAGSRTVK